MGNEAERELSEWAATDASRRRRAERLAREFDVAAMQWVGVLVAAVESGATVVVVPDDGRAYRCRILAVGADVAVAATDGDVDLAFALDRLRTVTLVDAPALGGGLDEPPESGTRLVEVATEWAAQRRRVTVHCATTATSGELIGVGVDVLSLRGDNGQIAYVRAESVSVISSST